MMAPVVFQWDGDAMTPLPRFSRLCNEEFVIGEHYKMNAQSERSWKTHRHFFVTLYDAWLNLPENVSMEAWAQSSEHLRKYALIKTGWYNSQTHACGSMAEAQRWARNLRPYDEYSITVQVGSTVVVYKAKSQSTKAMGARDFQQSKNDVLDFAAGLLG